MAGHTLNSITLLARVYGRVQGVCFRYYTDLEARRLGLHGWVRNCPDGSVECCMHGDPGQISLMKEWLHHGPTHASVERVEFSDADLTEEPHGFSVRY